MGKAQKQQNRGCFKTRHSNPIPINNYCLQDSGKSRSERLSIMHNYTLLMHKNIMKQGATPGGNTMFYRLKPKIIQTDTMTVFPNNEYEQVELKHCPKGNLDCCEDWNGGRGSEKCCECVYAVWGVLLA